MNRLAMILAFALLISLGFSWTAGIDYPACLNVINIGSAAFTHSIANSVLSCSVSQAYPPTYTSSGNATTVSQVSDASSNTLNSYSSCFTQFYSTPVACSFATVSNIAYNISVNGTYSGNVIFTGGGSCSGNASSSLNVSNGTSTIILTSDQAITIVKNGSVAIFSDGTTNVQFNTIINFNITSSGYTNSCYASATASANVAIYTTPQGILTSSVNEINSSTNTTAFSTPYISFFGDGVLRSNFTSGRLTTNDTSTFCKAVLYYGTNQIIPDITFVPGVAAYPDFYDGFSTSYIINNTVVYVHDKLTSQIYIVPAFICTSNTTVYTIATLFYSSGSTTSFPLPQLPLQKTCFQTDDMYNINTVYSALVEHAVYYSNQTSFQNFIVTSQTFNYSVNATLYPNINYTVNGFTQCLRNNNTSLLGLTPIGIPSNAYKPITWLLFIGSVGIALAVPFAVIFPVLLNEMFQLLTLYYMAEIVVLTGIVSVLLRGSDKNTVKASIVYFLFGIVILGAFFAKSNLPSPDFTGAIGNMTSIIQDPTKADIGSFVVGAPNFIVAIFGFVLNLPSLLSSAIFTPLQALSPAIYSFLTAFLTVFIYGAYVYILLVAWEKVANRFQQV